MPLRNEFTEFLNEGVRQIMQDVRFSVIDRCRVDLLHSACLHRDYHFMALHLANCLAVTNQAAFHGLGFIEYEHKGMKILQTTLLPIASMNYGLLQLFGRFPWSAEVLTTDAFTQKLMIANKRFLLALESSWDDVQAICRHRGHPPTVQELDSMLSVSSPTMQKTIYFIVHQQISGSGNHPLDRRAVQLFNEDQNGWHQGTQPSGERYKQAQKFLRADVTSASRWSTQLVGSQISPVETWQDSAKQGSGPERMQTENSTPRFQPCPRRLRPRTVALESHRDATTSEDPRDMSEQWWPHTVARKFQTDVALLSQVSTETMPVPDSTQQSGTDDVTGGCEKTATVAENRSENNRS